MSEQVKELIKLELIPIDVPAKWDGRWRLILFDVPEVKRQLRDQVRHLIKKFRCVRLQQSVWIHPFACHEQFRQIVKAYGTNRDILLIETNEVEGASQILKIFRKTYPRTKF